MFVQDAWNPLLRRSRPQRQKAKMAQEEEQEA